MSDPLDDKIDLVAAAAAATSGFLGMPISGEITDSYERTAQRPKSEFAPLVKAAMDVPGVTRLYWRQYTPYFNDGDACVFGAHSLEVTVDGEDIDDLDWGGDGATRVLGKRPVTWDNGKRVTGDYTGPNEARYDTLRALNAALLSGAFDDVLLKLFGDHCEVTITPGKIIQVDSVEHD